jgi:hypothetical protein
MGPAHVYEFIDDEGFYASLHDALLHTRDEVLLTHMQAVPPRGYRITSPYYLDIIRHAYERPACVIKRIITLPNEAMTSWAYSQQEDMENVDNFLVRVLPNLSVPYLNMAVLDRHNVFLASNDREARSSAALWMYSAAIGNYYANYYNSLWQQATDLPTALTMYEQGAW